MFSFSKGISQKLCLETHRFYATSLFLYVVGSEYEYGRISPAEQTKQTLTQRPLWYRWFFACKDSSVINGLYVVVGTVLYRVDIVHVKDLSGSKEANKHPYRAQREQRTCNPNINCFHSAIRQNNLHGLVHGPPHSAVVERLLPRLPPCRTLVFLCSPATSWNLPRVTIIARFLIADSKLLTAIVNKTWTWICLDVSYLDLSLRRPLRIWKSADRFVCKTAHSQCEYFLIFWWERDAQCCQNGAQMAQESWKKSRAEPFTCLGSSLRNLASVLPLCGLLSKRCGHDMLMTSRKIHDFELERCN